MPSNIESVSAVAIKDSIISSGIKTNRFDGMHRCIQPPLQDCNCCDGGPTEWRRPMTKLLASSHNIDGILQLINEYYHSKDAVIVPCKDNATRRKVYVVYTNNKLKPDVIVRWKGSRYRFELIMEKTND